MIGEVYSKGYCPVSERQSHARPLYKAEPLDGMFLQCSLMAPPLMMPDRSVRIQMKLTLSISSSKAKFIGIRELRMRCYRDMRLGIRHPSPLYEPLQLYYRLAIGSFEHTLSLNRPLISSKHHRQARTTTKGKAKQHICQNLTVSMVSSSIKGNK